VGEREAEAGHLPWPLGSVNFGFLVSTTPVFRAVQVLIRAARQKYRPISFVLCILVLIKILEKYNYCHAISSYEFTFVVFKFKVHDHVATETVL